MERSRKKPSDSDIAAGMAVTFSSDGDVIEFYVEGITTPRDMRLLKKIKSIFGNPSCSEDKAVNFSYESVNSKSYN